jgi:lysophospholipase L1-like esterase
MKIQSKSRLLMIGDSITDCGRFYDESGLGDGYVRFIDDMLKEKYPQLGIEVINRGISGNTIRDLKHRWQQDVLDLKPDWLSLMIGINDVWQQIDHWLPEAHWVTIAEYERTLDELVGLVASSLNGLILMTPYVLELGKTDEMRVKMDRYGSVVRKIARKYDAVFVDTQAAFNDFLQRMDVRELSNDRVHMNAVGHQVLAKAFLAAVE